MYLQFFKEGVIVQTIFWEGLNTMNMFLSNSLRRRCRRKDL